MESLRFSRGDTVNLSLDVTNTGNMKSTGLTFLLLDPEHHSYYVNMSETIEPDETRTIDLSFETSDESPIVILLLPVVKL